MPPVPPQVAGQQGPPPIRQFAQGGGQPPSPGAGMNQNSDQLLSQLVDSVGKQMTQIAQITSQTKPELVPILKQAVQALVMFAGKIKTSNQAPAAQPGQPQSPQGEGGTQGTGGEGAPEAGGGAAMGVQQ